MREGLDGKVENFNQLPQEVQVAAIIIIIITITIIIPDKIIITRTIIGSTHWTIFQISPLLSRALEGWLRSLLDWRPTTRGFILDIFSFKRI